MPSEVIKGLVTHLISKQNTVVLLIPGMYIPRPQGRPGSLGGTEPCVIPCFSLYTHSSLKGSTVASPAVHIASITTPALALFLSKRRGCLEHSLWGPPGCWASDEQAHGWPETLRSGRSPSPSGRSRTEKSHTRQHKCHFKTEELLISAISRLIFSDSICLQVTETMGREIVGKGDYCIYNMFTDFLKSSMNMIMWMLLNFVPSFSASSAKMGLVETKLAIIPGGGMNCSRSSWFVLKKGPKAQRSSLKGLILGESLRPSWLCSPVLPRHSLLLWGAGGTVSVVCSLQAFPNGFFSFKWLGHHIILRRLESCPHSPPLCARFLVALPGQSLGGGQRHACSVAAERTLLLVGASWGKQFPSVDSEI